MQHPALRVLEVEQDALEEMRAEVHRIAMGIAALIGLSGKDKQTAVAAIRAGARDIQAEITRIIISVRQGATGLATDIYEIQIRVVPLEDEIRAEAAGKSYAAAWALAALALLVQGHLDLLRANKLTDSRLQRIAATEAYSAYATAVMAMEPQPDAMVRWDAILDRRTCKRCKAHDGETVPLGSEFSGGDVPGLVHPICRCVPIVFTAS